MRIAAHRADLHTAERVETGDRHRQDRRLARCQDQAVEQVVPRQGEPEDRRRADPGQHLGQHHEPERGKAGEPVDLGLLLQRRRHGLEEPDQEPGDHRQNETQVREDHRHQRVGQPQRVGHRQEREHQHRRWEYLRGEHPEAGQRAACAEPGDRVGAHAADDDADADGDQRDQGAAPGRAEDARGQHVVPARQRRGEVQQEWIIELLRGFHAGQRDPHQREGDGDTGSPQQRHPQRGDHPGSGHRLFARSIRRNATTMTARTTTSTTNAIDAAEPSRKNWMPVW